MTEIPPFLQVIAGACVGGFGAYAAIRERLARLETQQLALGDALQVERDRTSALVAVADNTATRAHIRIDGLMGREKS